MLSLNQSKIVIVLLSSFFLIFIKNVSSQELDNFVELPSQAKLISEAIITQQDILPIVISDQPLDSYRIFQLEESMDNNLAIKYFFDNLNLSNFQIEQVLRSDFNFLSNTSILLAGENGSFSRTTNNSPIEHFPPILKNSGEKWLLFVKKVSQAADLGQDDVDLTTSHYENIKNVALVGQDLYTIFKQQVGFEINDQNKEYTVSADLIKDIKYFYGPLKSILASSEQVTPETKAKILNNIITQVGRDVAVNLIEEWKPLANYTTPPTPTPITVNCKAKTVTKINGSQSTFTASCPAGCDFQEIQSSTDLQNWLRVHSIGPDGLGDEGADGNYIHTFDVAAAGRKFFRAKCTDISQQEQTRMAKAWSYQDNLMQKHRLLAKWSFDHQANPGIDSLGTTMLTLYGNPQFTKGVKAGSLALVPSLNKCAYLDGEVYQNYPLLKNEQNLALTAWVKTNDPGVQGSIFVYTTENVRVWLMLSAGKLNAIIGSTDNSKQLTLNSSKVLNDLRWHQVGLELDFKNSKARLIIDGEIEQNTSKTLAGNCGIIKDGELDFRSCSVPLVDSSSVQPFGIGANNQTCNGAYLGYQSVAAIDDPAIFLLEN